MRPHATLGAIAVELFAALAFVGAVRADETQPAPVTANSHCPFAAKERVEISGTIQNLGTLQEEPQAQINSYFDLVTRDEPCGEGRIMVFAPGITPCSNGDRATLTGNYYAADKSFIDIAMMDAWEVKCSFE